MDYWKHVLWPDETKISLFGSDGVKCAWGQPGEEYKDKCVLPTVKHGGVMRSRAAWVLPALGSYSSLREPWMPTCTVTYWSRAGSPPFRRLGHRAVFQHDNDPKHTFKTTTALLKKLRVKVICGASSNGRWSSARSLTSTRSVMSSWRSGRGLQWQPVKLWWTPCPRRFMQCWKIMVATQCIDTLGPIWTFSFRGVLTFVASGLDINGCALSYFEGTEHLHCYTSCTLTTLHYSRRFLQCCHMKRHNKIFTKMWGVYSLLWDIVYINTYISSIYFENMCMYIFIFI